MSRPASHFPAAALVLLSMTGCNGSNHSKITSTSEGARTPTISATAQPETTAEVPTVMGSVSYESAEAAFNKRQYQEATQLFTAYTSGSPDNAWGYYMLGLASWKAGQPEKAIEAFDRSLQLDPGHRKSLFNSSRVLLDTGKPKDALDRIEKALALEPLSNEGLRLLGRARYELGDIDGAIESYHRALVVDDRDVWSMNNLGLIYIQQDRSCEALPPLARAVELRSNAPVFQNNLGMALERSGYPRAAASAYEAALAVDSTYGKASVGLTRVTGNAQQPESTTVDLGALSNQFQAEIEQWRGNRQATDSVVGSSTTDSSQVSVDTGIDSVVVGGGMVSDTLDECAGEEDQQ
jgi:tetratricopeptide (TPR) repeat protein